ncbi:MAG: biopolymer transporter ExbD [Planctomycetota bacterium]|jgi:biopolymer transport protein ExbD|nr:biopolymer transporter ExbD [Planctomycetota bacterium]MDP6990229.1 biopolymer transporter ExbD [Planctomycetota bacterium]
MAKKKRKSAVQGFSEESCDLPMTPMIDVTFLLLIFFMCTLKFKTLEGKLAAYLPKDVGVNQTDAEPIEKVEITIKVLKEGTKWHPRGESHGPWSGTPGTRYSYGSDRLLEYAIGPRKTTRIEELSNRLTQLHKADITRPATIDSRQGTVYEDVIEVLDIVMEIGFEECTFVGSYE